MRTGVILVAALAAGVAGGCGSASTHRTPAERAFIAQADAGCRQVDASRLQAGLNRPAASKSPASAARTLGQRAALRERQLRMFRALMPPAKDRRTFNQLVTTYGQTAAGLRSSQRATAAGDRATLRRNSRKSARLNRRYSKLARKLGLHVCGQTAKR